MWNQTGEADWGSEMDRHSPTGPWLCCQRSVDYMTEGGMGGGKGWMPEGCKWHLYKGIQPRKKKRLPSLQTYPFSLTKSDLCAATFALNENQCEQGDWPCCCDAQHSVV